MFRAHVLANCLHGMHRNLFLPSLKIFPFSAAKMPGGKDMFTVEFKEQSQIGKAKIPLKKGGLFKIMAHIN